ncbi:MAG: hypothetical protein ACJAUM_002501 [Pseudomonadales bacterium]|jgi:hypothetical protein
MDLGKLSHQLSQQLSHEPSEVSSAKKIPPVELWDPPFCGDMDLVIKSNGQWWQGGTPFTRAKLVSLFSSVLKKENDDYFLVTPVEKIGIQVEDVPFLIVDWHFEDSILKVRTQVGDEVSIGPNNPIELRHFNATSNQTDAATSVETLVPYCLIRRNLWGRIHQNVMYQWAEIATERKTEHGNELIMHSQDYEFSLGTF